MEVCGTHTHEIFRLGIRKLLPKQVELISGPGCPVCVTPVSFIDEAIYLALEKGVTICTFGDLVRVPGTNMSLAGAMTIFHMPIYRKLAEIISSGTLGPLRLIQVNFGSYKEYDMNNRFFNRNLAGGAMLDIGVYALSLIRWFFAETANQVLSQVKYAPTGVDEQAGILLMNPAGEMATVTLSLHAKQPKRATIAFDKGYIEIFEYPRAMEATITYTGDGHKETISAGETADALSYEVADMEAAVCSGDLSTIESLMHLNYSQDVMHIMTEIRNNWGMKYPEEE